MLTHLGVIKQGAVTTIFQSCVHPRHLLLAFLWAWQTKPPGQKHEEDGEFSLNDNRPIQSIELT